MTVSRGTERATESAASWQRVGFGAEQYIPAMPGARAWLRGVPAGLVLAVWGCSGLGDNFREPELQLDRAVVRGVGLAGGNLDLIVTVVNPNNFPLHADRLRVGVEVGSSHLGDITYEDDFTVSENGSTTLALPLRFGWLGVGGAIRAALGYGDLPYKMKGEATLKIPGGFHKVVPFTREGRAPLTRPGGGSPLAGSL
jgi:LEA14-like dessication related protein